MWTEKGGLRSVMAVTMSGHGGEKVQAKNGSRCSF